MSSRTQPQRQGRDRIKHHYFWLTYKKPQVSSGPCLIRDFTTCRDSKGDDQAFAVVHWTMKVKPSSTGWLDEGFHRDFRELLVHACARQSLACPAYCLMPDHLHLMWMGLSLESDQLIGTRFLRTHLNRLLTGQSLESRQTVVPASKSARKPGRKLQMQAHDHVLREEERKRNAFARVCFYILANPVRAELVKREQDWKFSGAVMPGYPELYPFHDDFWDIYWKIYSKRKEAIPASPPP